MNSTKKIILEKNSIFPLLTPLKVHHGVLEEKSIQGVIQLE